MTQYDNIEIPITHACSGVTCPICYRFANIARHDVGEWEARALAAESYILRITAERDHINKLAAEYFDNWQKALSQIRPLKTECKHGHPYDEANTYVKPNGKRECRACSAERSRRLWASKAKWRRSH